MAPGAWAAGRLVLRASSGTTPALPLLDSSPGERGQQKERGRAAGSFQSGRREGGGRRPTRLLTSSSAPARLLAVDQREPERRTWGGSRLQHECGSRVLRVFKGCLA